MLWHFKVEARASFMENFTQNWFRNCNYSTPLVYGEGVKGNFLRLLNLINKNIPLPFGKIDNHRSIMGLDNLIDVIICSINHNRAAGKTFLVSDDDIYQHPN